jgi:meiosis-specific APC/C activator protein AMA1
VGFSEDLLVGDEIGNIYFYAVNWGLYNMVTRQDATITLLRRIVVHTQQICGLAWSHDGEQFATGGNDNTAFLFETVNIEGSRNAAGVREANEHPVVEGGEKHRWQHGAAVKAIAFCPWQKTLLATGTFPFMLYHD